MKRALALVAVIGCGPSQPREVPLPGPAGGTPTASAPAPTASAPAPIASEEITFDGGVPGTITYPKTPGKHRGVVLMVGSGPTDRDWNSPLITTGTNGSGKLLAEALAARGNVVLRFDKAGVGKNPHALGGDATIDVYRDEGRAALATLRARPDVDPAHLFIAGHSEGAYHAVRVAEAEGPAVAGVLLLSGAGRTLESILLAQIDAQLRVALPAQADAIMASLRKAFADFAAGQSVDPKQVTQIPGLQMALTGAFLPATATLARSLLRFDPLPVLAKLPQPVFIYNGEKDVQVDPDVDAKALVAARGGTGPITTEFLAPDANHVLEHEPRAKSEITPATAGYNTPDRVLDSATVDAIAGWLAQH